MSGKPQRAVLSSFHRSSMFVGHDVAALKPRIFMSLANRILVAVTCAWAAAATPVPAASIAAGPAGDAFYTPPSPLPAGPRGSVIWTRPLDGTMALPSATSNTLVLYRSTLNVLLGLSVAVGLLVWVA